MENINSLINSKKIVFRCLSLYIIIIGLFVYVGFVVKYPSTIYGKIVTVSKARIYLFTEKADLIKVRIKDSVYLDVVFQGNYYTLPAIIDSINLNSGVGYNLVVCLNRDSLSFAVNDALQRHPVTIRGGMHSLVDLIFWNG